MAVFICNQAWFDPASLVAATQRDIIPVEGLLLDDVAPGLYTVHCLPLKLIGSDGAPARCILVT